MIFGSPDSMYFTLNLWEETGYSFFNSVLDSFCRVYRQSIASLGNNGTVIAAVYWPYIRSLIPVLWTKRADKPATTMLAIQETGKQRSTVHGSFCCAVRWNIRPILSIILSWYACLNRFLNSIKVRIRYQAQLLYWFGTDIIHMHASRIYGIPQDRHYRWSCPNLIRVRIFIIQMIADPKCAISSLAIKLEDFPHYRSGSFIDLKVI